MTRDELAQGIRNAFTREGDWNAEALSACDAGFWHAWIAARLRGEDPWVPYARDEYPQVAFDLFVRFAQAAPSLGIATAACQDGAAHFLASLNWDPESGEPAHLLRNTLYLAGKLRARHPKAVEVLRDIIRQQKLLKRTDWPLELHRTALYALASLQTRGECHDEPIWKAWLKPWASGDPPHQYDFIPAAFSGLAMSRRNVPARELRQVLAFYTQACAKGHPMALTPAILALWVDREGDSDAVREEIWRAVQGGQTPESDWDIIRLCASRAWPCIRPYREMQQLYPTERPERVSARPSRGLWDRNAALAPALA